MPAEREDIARFAVARTLFQDWLCEATQRLVVVFDRIEEMPPKGKRSREQVDELCDLRWRKDRLEDELETYALGLELLGRCRGNPEEKVSA